MSGALTMADWCGISFPPHPPTAAAQTSKRATVRRTFIILCLSTPRGVVNPRGLQRPGLELLRQLERPPGRLASRRLSLRRRRVPEEESSTEVVVVALVGLDRLPIEPRRRLVPDRLAEVDELPILDDRDRLPGELSGGDALDRRPERVQVVEQRAVPLGERIEVAGVEAQL